MSSFRNIVLGSGISIAQDWGFVIQLVVKNCGAINKEAAMFDFVGKVTYNTSK